MSLIESIGWFGTIVYLLNHAYLSLISNWREKIYFSGNLIAAIALMVSAASLFSWQALCINGFWALISFLLLSGFDIKKTPVKTQWFYFALAFLWVYLLANTLKSDSLDISALGWTSTLAFCASYLLFTSGSMSIHVYLLWNTYAALALLPQLWIDTNWPNFGLEVAWAFISAYVFFRKRQEPHLID